MKGIKKTATNEEMIDIINKLVKETIDLKEWIKAISIKTGIANSRIK